MIKIMVLVCYFGISNIVFMLALLFGKLLCQMLITMDGLEQY